MMNKDQKERELIKTVLQGNSTAFADIVDKYKDMVYTIAIKIIQRKEDAEEIAQDTFIKAFNALHTYKGNAKLSTWMYRIAYNTAISKLRKDKHKKKEYSIDEKSDVGINQITGTLQPLEMDDRITYLNKALQYLSSGEKIVITLFYLEEKSIREIEKITGWSQSNIKVKLYRGRKNLYSKLCRILNTEIEILK